MSKTDVTAINAKTISVNGTPVSGSAAPSGNLTTYDQIDADTVLALNGVVVQGTLPPGAVFTNYDNLNVTSGVSVNETIKYGSLAGGVTVPTLPPVERLFSYNEIQSGWTLTRSENNPAYLQLFNSNDAESASVYMAIVEGSSAAARLDDQFLTSASDRASSVYFEASVDGGPYTRTPYNADKDDFQVFSGLSDGPHLVSLRTIPGRFYVQNINKSGSPMRVTGGAPKIKNVDKWLVPSLTEPNMHYAHSMISTLPNLNDTNNNWQPKKYGHFLAGGAPSMTFRENVSEIWVVTVQRMIHLFDGTTHTVYDTGSDIAGNDSSRTRVYRITGLSGLKTYHIWTSFIGNYSQFAVGLVGGTGQALANPKRVLDQFGDSITYGTLPAADLPPPGNKATNGTGYSDVYRVAAKLGYVGCAMGEGGIGVAQLNDRLDSWLPPRVISSTDAAIVAIGQNGGVPDTSVYNSIITKLLAKGYGRVVCRGVIPTMSGDSTSINATISGIVTTRNDAKVKYMNVDSWGDIDRPDGVHPGIVGYNQIVARAPAILGPLLA